MGPRDGEDIGDDKTDEEGEYAMVVWERMVNEVKKI